MGNVDWNTIWTAVGALATIAAVVAVYFAGRQLRLDAWLKAQEVWVGDEFTKARGRVFRHLRGPEASWDREDQEAGLLVCRRTDEFCRLAPYFAVFEYRAREEVLKVWDDPLGKSWALLEPLVKQERKHVGWSTKWNAFQNLGRAALERLPRDQRKKLNSIAQRLEPQITKLLEQRFLAPPESD